jgi:hypothetical protein
MKGHCTQEDGYSNGHDYNPGQCDQRSVARSCIIISIEFNQPTIIRLQTISMFHSRSFRSNKIIIRK